MNHRVWLGSAGLGLWVVAAVVKDVLRPMAGAEAPAMVLLLGSAPSLLSATAIPLLFLAVHPRPGNRDIRHSGLWAAALVTLSEGLERFLPGSVSDWHDWLASIAGVLLGTLVARHVLQHRRETEPRATSSA